MSRFTEGAWRDTADLYRKILDLPFNRELAAGALSEDRFRFYMIQDSLYLEQYSRALSMASAKATDIPAMQMFARAAEEAVVVERALHGSYFEKFGIAPDTAAAAEPSPTCYGYANFLLATALRSSYEELVAAVLPCFWIYWEVGRHIAKTAAPENPYRAWIETYSDESFGATVEAAIAVTDRLADASTEAQRDAMRRAFKRSAQFEWMFWDSAYRMEDWPIQP